MTLLTLYMELKLLSCANMQIGNAVINDETDNVGMYDYFANHALISRETSRKIHEYCDFSSNAKVSEECFTILVEAGKLVRDIDIYNIYYPRCLDANLTSSPKRISVSYRLLLVYF